METIAIADADAIPGEIERVLEQKLRDSLNGPEHFIAFNLRPEQRGSVDLVEWIYKCKNLAAEAEKQMIVVTATAEQAQYLELSHPDQELKYVASIDELKNSLRHADSKQEPFPAAGAADFTAPPERAAVAAREPASSAAALDQSNEFMPVIEQTPLSIGAKVKIAGEYVCLGCSTSRMWLKGEMIEKCSNAECIRPAAGWQLTCELF